MKFFVPIIATFAALTAAAPTAANDAAAAPRTITDLITSMTKDVRTHVAALNQTIAAVPANANEAQKKEASVAAIQQISDITAIFHSANAEVANAQAAAKKPTLGDLPHDVLGQLDGRPIVLAKLLLPLLQELNPALQSVLTTLSLGEVYVALQPLLRTELPALVVGLSNLVQGLLGALAPLLTALGGILGPLLLGLGL